MSYIMGLRGVCFERKIFDGRVSMSDILGDIRLLFRNRILFYIKYILGKYLLKRCENYRDIYKNDVTCFWRRQVLKTN